MEIPNILRRAEISLSPMHRWPRVVKRIMLAVFTLIVLTAYGLLIGTLIISLVMLAKIFS